MGKRITPEQLEILVGNLGKLPAKEIAALAGLDESFVYRKAHALGKSAKMGKELPPRPEKIPEILIKHMPVETKEERLERYRLYVQQNKAKISTTEMALTLGINIEAVERLARVPTVIVRAKGTYSNSFDSSIANEYWEEEKKLTPKKEKKVDDD